MNEAYRGRGLGERFDDDDVVQSSEIAETFADATVFLTGGTGFVGKIFLEKLLRSCTKLKRMYLLVRPKKGKDENQRFQEIFEGPNMEPLKRCYPNYMEKVSILSGDCALPDLGLSSEDKSKIIDEVNFVIHCAATVRFDEKLKTAAYINVRGVIDILTIAKQMKNLKGFLHVSTAFSNCILKSIDEAFYKPGLSAQELLQLVEMFDEETMSNMTPQIIGQWPNTYVYTKAISEDYIKNEAKNLPLAILRPAIIIASVNEPLAGWIDNIYGATGVLVAAGIGLMRSLYGNKKNLAELVPVDYVVNTGLAVLWDIVKKENAKSVEREVKTEGRENEEVPIFHVVSSPESPITWERFTKLSETAGAQIPSKVQLWYIIFSIRQNKLLHLLAVFFLHTVPAYLADSVLYCIGKKPMMVKGYEKIHKFMHVISYFTMRQWNFKNHNTQELWDKMNDEDQRMFQFSMRNFDWENYFVSYTKGIRVYILKDPLDTIPAGRRKYLLMTVVHFSLMAVLCLLSLKLLYVISFLNF